LKWEKHNFYPYEVINVLTAIIKKNAIGLKQNDDVYKMCVNFEKKNRKTCWNICIC
jgi:hypothetical protein